MMIHARTCCQTARVVRFHYRIEYKTYSSSSLLKANAAVSRADVQTRTALPKLAVEAPVLPVGGRGDPFKLRIHVAVLRAGIH